MTTDDEFLSRFEDCSLTYEEWTHRAHVKMAYLYLNRFPFAEALDRIRIGIKRFNKSKKVPEGPLEGYNETTTQAFAHLIAATMQAYGEKISVASADEFCDAHPQLMAPQVLRLFYSTERRIDPAGKHQFVPPDLTELPRFILG